MSEDQTKYMLVGDIVSLKSQFEKCRVKTLAIADGDDTHALMMIAMIIGRELGLEGKAGPDMIDESVELVKKIRATTQT